MNPKSRSRNGLRLLAPDPWTLAAAEDPAGPRQLLSEEEQAALAAIASIARFRKGETIYAEGDAADAAFNVISGVVTSGRRAADGRRSIAGFLHPGDIFGLAEAGRYVNDAVAASAVTLYRLPTPALRRLLARNPDLDLNVIAKLCQELRRQQRHAFLLDHKHAVSRVAMFLAMMEGVQAADGPAPDEIHLAMSRIDVAEYVGLSPSAVSRAFHALAAGGAIATPDRRRVRILDHARLEAAIDDPTGWAARRRREAAC